MPRNTPLKNVVFRDLDLNFTVHPNSKDLISLKDDAAVKRALRNLLLYDHYEKPFHPEFGSNIRRTLFENFSSQTAIFLRSEITQVIANYEPRVEISSVDVISREDENRYEVILKYFLVNSPSERITQIFLERLR